MSGKHTPGPWHLEEVLDDTGRIKHLCPVGTDDLSLLTVLDHNGTKFAAIYLDADAHLIAAAPMLLAACRMVVMLRQLGGMLPGSRDVVQAIVEAAQAAIDKAEGR